MKPEVHVSDHAVLRWLERECGVPVEEIRSAIASSCGPYKKHSPVNIKIGKINFVLTNGAVVTALKKNTPVAARDNRET